MRETRLAVEDLGRMGFEEALSRQEQTHAERAAGRGADTLFLVEHPPVYTLGRRADASDILADNEVLARLGIAVVRTTRGGQVTYHGPGQLVAYPVLGLEGRGAAWYVGRLEESVISTLAAFGLTGLRDPTHRGVWVGGEKIAAVGVRIARQVSMHGLALNVRVSEEAYRGIVPCGIRDRGVTSMHRHVASIRMDEVKPVFVSCFREVFDYGA